MTGFSTIEKIDDIGLQYYTMQVKVNISFVIMLSIS
jgi:hypothetical protein